MKQIKIKYVFFNFLFGLSLGCVFFIGSWFLGTKITPARTLSEFTELICQQSAVLIFVFIPAISFTILQPIKKKKIDNE